MNDCYFEKKDWRLCKKEVSQVVEACNVVLIALTDSLYEHFQQSLCDNC